MPCSICNKEGHNIQTCPEAEDCSFCGKRVLAAEMHGCGNCGDLFCSICGESYCYEGCHCCGSNVCYDCNSSCKYDESICRGCLNDEDTCEKFEMGDCDYQYDEEDG